MFRRFLTWLLPKKAVIAIPEVIKDYRMYHFDPDNLEAEGYVYWDSFATQQDCDDNAFKCGFTHYRIEIVQPWGSMVVFETPAETTEKA
jgi:hypothetical protein